MTLVSPERVVPATASDMLRVCKDVDASRDRDGLVRIHPSYDAEPPYVGFGVLLGMTALAGERPGSALRIGSYFYSGQLDTQLVVPTLGRLADIEVSHQGRIHRDDVVAMARNGVQLLDYLHGLEQNERQLCARDDEISDHVRDDFVGPKPNLSVEDLGSVPDGVLERGALQVAKRILLDA